MPLISWFSIAALLLCFFVQAKGTRQEQKIRFVKLVGCISVLFIIFFYAYLVYAQYVLWRDSGSVARFLVPPYQGAGYVIGYHFIRFALFYLISFAIAILFMAGAARLNRRFENRFFENEEPYLGAVAVYLLGNPAWQYAWIMYFFLIFGIYALFHLFILRSERVRQIQSRSRKEEIDSGERFHALPRLPMYWLWIPVALAVIGWNVVGLQAFTVFSGIAL